MALCPPFSLRAQSLHAQTVPFQEPPLAAGLQAASLELPEAPQPPPPAEVKPVVATAAAPVPCSRQAVQKQITTPEQLKAEESQRIAGFVNNINTVINRGVCVPALTPGQKWSLVYHSTTAPYTIGLAGVLAGYDEISGAHNGYGWGAQGYFKRFGAQYADEVDGMIIGNGILPILLHQDPRYYQLGAGHPVGRRIWHAAISNVVCFGDNGKTQFNVSNILGNFISGAISNAYYPANERGLGLTAENAVTVTLEGALGSQLLEFSPEINKGMHHLLHHKKHPAPAMSPAAVAASPTPL